MLITDPAALGRFSDENRVWQGIPGVAVTGGGRIFVCFYSGGIKEEIGNYAIVIKSDDGGASFSKPIAVAYPEDGFRCYDPCLWIDPLGRLWFFWARMPEHAVFCSVCEDPDADTLSWSAPRVIGHDVMMNKPTVLSTGEWLFPIAVWNSDVRTLPPEFDTPNRPYGSYAYISLDNGVTISPLGFADVPDRSFDEHMIYERGDGSLVMLVRTRYGIGRSVSLDRGRTWGPGEDSGIAGPDSRFFIGRLRSGRLLMINHVGFSGRNNLTALLSEDDGASWKYSMMLDPRSTVSYPDAQQVEDGSIFIVHDRERGGFRKSLNEALSCAREILLSRITEEDIMNGRLVSSGSFLCRIANKLGKYKGSTPDPYIRF